jgi:hypothetical protein
VLGLLLSAPACRDATFEPPPRPQQKLLEKLKSPPLNLPARSPRASSNDRQTPTARLPAGNGPGIVVATKGRIVRGPLRLSGRVSAEANRLEFVVENQPPLQIEYQLPAPLKPPSPVKGPGTLVFQDRTNPGGPGRQLVITARDAPLLAEFWLKSPEPIGVDVGAGLRLKQRTGPPEGIHDVALDIVEETQNSYPLLLRAPTTIKTRAGVLQTFVESSYVVNTSDATGQYAGGYILHVWIVRSGP